MFSFITLVLLLALYRARRTVFVLAYGFNSVVFALVIDVLLYGGFSEQMVHAKIDIDESLVYLAIVNMLGLLAFCVAIRRDRLDREIVLFKPGINIVMSVCVTLSVAVAVYNTIRVGDIGLMVVSPRQWELSWGRNAILNYIYFLHTIAAFLAIVMYWRTRKTKYAVVFVICVLVSPLLGIKSVIAHTVLIPICGFIILDRYKISRRVIAGGFVFVCIMVLFFSFVRGGGTAGIIGYITSGSVNSVYVIQNSNVVMHSPVGIFVPNIGGMVNWVERRLFAKPSVGSAGRSGGFILNDEYNVFHPILGASMLTAVSYPIAVAFLAFAINFVKGRRIITPSWLFV